MELFLGQCCWSKKWEDEQTGRGQIMKVWKLDYEVRCIDIGIF